MTLATRCPGCGTSFRVVADQLEVSEGWVRCGRCNDVFNATEALFETDTAQPVAAAAAGFARSPGAPSTQPPPSTSFASTQAQESLLPPSAADEEAADTDTLSRPVATAAPALAAATPAFVRRARRAEAWKRPRVRRAMGAGAAALGLGLAAQTTLLYRDPIAAHWPERRSALETLCGWAGCSVQPLRRISALAVDSSGLNPLDGDAAYRLSVVLRNRGEVEVMLPAIDLLLSDTQGRTLARRVLNASELGATSNTLAAGAELPLQARLSVGERRVAGYTIEIFYP
jgi:predicted Zn finger-like uncharacterized protein